MVIDLDRMDRNLDLVTQTLRRGGKHYRIVEKSLPNRSLIRYVAERSGAKRLMSFHQPFLNIDVEVFPDFDILMGKPLPVHSASLFYEKLRGPFDPSRQLQWLIDTPARLQQYLQLAQGLGTRLRANIEIDVGLHRGGVDSNATLGQMLELISANPQQLELAGFMGYDGHVGLGLPHIILRCSKICRADSGRGAWRTQGLVCRNQVGSSTPELTDGAFDERRVLGPRLSRVFCDKIT